jgi:hypothetical protein
MAAMGRITIGKLEIELLILFKEGFMQIDVQSGITLVSLIVTAITAISHIFQNKKTQAANDAHIATLKEKVVAAVPVAITIAKEALPIVETLAPKTAPAIEALKQVEQVIAAPPPTTPCPVAPPAAQ